MAGALAVHPMERLGGLRRRTQFPFRLCAIGESRKKEQTTVRVVYPFIFEPGFLLFGEVASDT